MNIFQSTWSEQFRAATAPIIGEPFWACLAEALATVECARGTHIIGGPAGINEIGYKAIPGKPFAVVATHETAQSSYLKNNSENVELQKTTARFRLFKDRAEQAASLLYLFRSSAYYESARLLFILIFYAAYAPGRTDGARELLRVFNQLVAAGHYPGIRPFTMLNSPPGDPDTIALNHAAARAGVRLFAELTR